MKLSLDTVVKSKVSLEEKFDFLYEMAQEILAHYQPCKIKFLKNGANCIDCSKSLYRSKPNVLCCDGCQYHTLSKGCMAEKPLTCKLWLCRTAAEKFPTCANKLDEIYEKADELDLLSFRGDRTDSLKNGYKESGHAPCNSMVI